MAIARVSGRKNVLINGFSFSGATFYGFYARRKEGQVWKWYTKDHKWQEASENMAEKYLFTQGEDITFLMDGETKAIAMVAQWKDERQGEVCGCGYAMFSNALMAHAFGGYKEKTYCNTREAFEQAVKNGYRYFEVDLAATTDNRLVLCHKFAMLSDGDGAEKGASEDNSYANVRKKSLYGQAIMDGKEFYQLVCQHPEYTFEVDFHKVEGKKASLRIEALLEDFQYDKAALDRLLIQAYSEKMHREMNSVYMFKHYQFLVGKSIEKLDKIITYCLENGICAVALRTNLAKPGIVKKIKNAGLYILCYTVNHDAIVAHKLLDSGVDTLCTDFVTPEMLQNEDRRFGRHSFYVYYDSGICEITQSYTEKIERGELEGSVEETSRQTLEYKDSKIWKNDGNRSLTPNCFAAEGKYFKGWKLQIRVDEKELWYCCDHFYHTKGDIDMKTAVRPYIFADCERLPEWNVIEGAKHIMVAVWENIEEQGEIPKK